MSGDRYVHGYTDREQDRLVSQSLFLERWMYEGIDFAKERTLLEVGCGVGAQLKILRRRFPHLTVAGVDRSDKQVQRASALLADDVAAGKASVRVADGTALPFADGAFDAVFLMWVLEHAHEPGPLLAEVRRVVRPGGRLVCSEVFNASIFIRPRCPAFERYWDAFNDFQIALGGDPHVGVRLGGMLADAGFDEVTIEPVVIQMDKRWRDPEERTGFIRYWHELFLSGAPGLIDAGRVDQALVDAMSRELLALADDRDAVFYVTAMRASARAPLTR